MIPVFIGGCGRSGTTILKKVLARLPGNAAINAEVRIIIDPNGALDLFRSLTDCWSPYQADYAVREFFALAKRCALFRAHEKALFKVAARFNAFALRYGYCAIGEQFGSEYYLARLAKLYDSIVRSATAGAWVGSPSFRAKPTILEIEPFEKTEARDLIGGFFNDLYDNLRPGTETTHWLDDTPFNILHAEQLLDLFPDMKLIHIHRHPFDIVCSYATKTWGGNDFEDISVRIANIFNRWFQVKATLPPNVCLEISLEQLIHQRDNVISEITDLLGLQRIPTQEIASTLLSAEYANIGRWRKELPTRSRNVIGHTLQHVFNTYEYDSSP